MEIEIRKQAALVHLLKDYNERPNGRTLQRTSMQVPVKFGFPFKQSFGGL